MNFIIQRTIGLLRLFTERHRLIHVRIAEYDASSIRVRCLMDLLQVFFSGFLDARRTLPRTLP